MKIFPSMVPSGPVGPVGAGATIAAATFQAAGNIATTMGSAQSDELGRFQARVPGGSYHITAARDGYGLSSAMVISGETVSLVEMSEGLGLWFHAPGVRPGIQIEISTRRREDANVQKRTYPYLRLCVPGVFALNSLSAREAEPWQDF